LIPTKLTEKNFKSKTNIFLIVGILLIAANLRVPLTSVGPLVDMIRDETGISNGAIGLLTTLPLLAFAVFSIIAPNIAERFGIKYILMVSLIVLLIGILMRSVNSITLLFLGTFILGSAIAMGNVLLPALIKQNFPYRIGIMTGLYTTFMNLFGALASGFSFPIAKQLHIGWRQTLASAAFLVIVTSFVWLPQITKKQRSTLKTSVMTTNKNVWRSVTAWYITLFMGLQSLLYFVVLSWPPEIFIHYGLAPSKAGWMLSLMLVFTIPANFIVPVLFDRTDKQYLVMLFIVAITFLGFGGILVWGGFLATVWSAFLGFGIGGCLSLSLTLVALRSNGIKQASQLSVMAQSIGYVLAAIGPVLFGMLRDITMSWSVSISAMMINCILLFIVGIGATKKKTVEQ